MNPRSQRGSGMLLALIVVLVITVVAVGVLRFASRELAGADAGRKHEALVQCAEAGRQLLGSQFRATGVSPTELTALNVNLDAAGTVKALGGHIGGTIDQVRLGDAADNGAESTGDITNIPFPNLAQKGGKPYIITVHCDDHGRQLEVEYRVRFGI
jgi:Tfp pilus assembly protein PilX